MNVLCTFFHIKIIYWSTFEKLLNQCSNKQTNKSMHIAHGILTYSYDFACAYLLWRWGHLKKSHIVTLVPRHNQRSTGCHSLECINYFLYFQNLVIKKVIFLEIILLKAICRFYYHFIGIKLYLTISLLNKILYCFWSKQI